jgi:Gpi18-like mannosyltransferase
MITAEAEGSPIPAAKAVASRRTIVAAPGLLYLGVQGIAVLALWLFSSLNNKTLNLHAWDGDWYLAIAKYGYTGLPTSMVDEFGHHAQYTATAFFPGYPMLIHLAEPMEGGNFAATAVTISVLSGIVAAFGVARLATKITGSRRVAMIAVVLVAAAPMSIVYSMAYPESMLLALAAWALVGVVEKQWTLAGWCAGMAGLVRPTAIAVIVVVLAVTIMAAVRNENRLAAISAAVVAPAGYLGYLTWVAIVSGSPWTYFRVQAAGWQTTFDFGVGTTKWLWSTLTKDGYAFTVITALLTVATVALLITTVRKVPLPTWVYAAVIVALALGESGIQFNKVRLLAPATIVLLLPVAARLSRLHVTKLAALSTLIAAGGIWFSAYSLTVWHYAI